MREIEKRIHAAIEGFKFSEAAAGLTMVLQDLAFTNSGGNEDIVKAIFHELADNYKGDVLH